MIDMTDAPLAYGKAGGTYINDVPKSLMRTIASNRHYRQNFREGTLIGDAWEMQDQAISFHAAPQVLTIGQRLRNIFSGGIAYVRKIKSARVATVEDGTWSAGHAEGRNAQIQKSLQS